MLEPPHQSGYTRRGSYPRRGRISFQVLIIVFIFGYFCKTTLYSLEDYYAGDCRPHSKTSSGEQERPQHTSSEAASYVGWEKPVDYDFGRDHNDHFVQALEDMFSMLPDELDLKDAVAPIEGTGEEKVREVGARARIFKQAFEAWEALHLFPIRGRMFVRQDTLQYLKRSPSLVSRLQLDHASILHRYEDFHSFLTRLSTLLFSWTVPYFPDLTSLHAQLWSGGRGIVLTGGDRQAAYLLTSIQSFRTIGCDLPVEIMYLGDEDLGPANRRKLEAIDGVITRDLSPMVNDKGWKLAGWALKPFAILLSSFREAIFIDADSLFLRDPAILFQDPDYKETGALFFKDRVIQPSSKRSWLKKILPAPVSSKIRQNRFWTGESSHMQESGVVVIDKWKHFVALLVITRMNGPDRDGNEQEGRVGVYDMVFGDKETFWLGHELVGDTSYAFHDGKVAVMGVAEVQRPSDDPEKNSHELRATELEQHEGAFSICAPQLVHLDGAGRPLWFNGWVLPNKFSNNPDLQPVNFESFIIEPSTIKDPGPWEMKEDNVLCLTSDHFLNLTTAEKETLNTTIQIARRVGAIGASRDI
ncbi:alpha-1,3-mannosyltransferase [Penicillium brasilianum]|uniref:Alpha-1,3-mannosyltransferase n=1 Tax=Penicillium brasilianum TaxID=104259 RepID=A0A1S9RU31_PENBI|nr:alpha-1,3-mannosyltransferase [Penicillium brasilianum]